MTRIIAIIFIIQIGTIFSQKNNKIAIIGGGMTGVSAAYYLHKSDSNAEIYIFEKEAKLGGNATTIEVENASGKKINIDVGPQYFTQGPWDDYISFLKENDAYFPKETASMVGSVVIQPTERNQKPHLITPINGDFRNEKFGKLLKFRKFNIVAHRVFKHPEKWQGVSVEKWVEALNFSLSYKTEIIYPFLAASLGTSVNEIKNTAVTEIVKLFAFRKPKQKDTFSVMTKGMGNIINEIARKFPTEINVLTSSEVLEMQNDTTLQILINGTTETMTFDYIIFATHPYQAAKILKNSERHSSLIQPLTQFEYFDAQIVLHRDTKYALQQTPAFLNIFTDSNDVKYSTMNLSMISSDYLGIYKSWMPTLEIEKTKANGTFIHAHTFKHPLITQEFLVLNKRLNELVNSFQNLSIVGAWSEGLETQNSAVLSGKRAVNEYLLWKSNDYD